MTIDIENLVIHQGSHANAQQGHCILEVVSMLAGERWGDHPECVCPVVGAFARRLNDTYLGDDEGRTAAFRPLIRKLMGTRGSTELMQRRMFAAADAAVHIFAPLAMDSRKRPEWAAKLRAAPEIVDKASAIAARDIAREVRAAASADDAYAAAYADDAYAAAYAAYAANDAYAAAYAAYAANDAYAAAYAIASSEVQARREALAHGITLLEKLCNMRDPS